MLIHRYTRVTGTPRIPNIYNNMPATGPYRKVYFNGIMGTDAYGVSHRVGLNFLTKQI